MCSLYVASISVRLPRVVQPTPTPDYTDPHADPEILFAGFNNETGVDNAIIPDLAHFVLFGHAGHIDFTTFLCILATIKVYSGRIHLKYK